VVAREVDGIVCFGGDRWGDVKRPSQMMLRLSERVPVVYVEPYLSVTSLVKNWRTAFGEAARPRLRRAVARELHEVAPGLNILTSMVAAPPNRLSSIMPAGLLGTVGEAQHRRAAARAYSAAGRLGIRSPLVWISYPMPLPPAPDGLAPPVVYDCMDRWTDFPNALSDERYRSLVTNAEQGLLDSADLVLCSAEGLYQAKLKTARGAVLLVRNGADVEHFAPKRRPVPKELAGLPGPIVGYIGAVADWFDFELVRSAALSRPEWSFVFIGALFGSKSAGDPRSLRLIADLPNVHLLGARPYRELPPYLEAFDVATIPFKINGLTEDTDPIKVYEYLAAGVPVVSTPLPEVRRLPGVRLASDAAGFVEQCEAARRERFDARLIADRIGVATENSWAARARVAWDAVLDGPATTA